ncbi:MAG: ThiF family adenylyltransferase, partial [Planctomycetota bacterium]
MPTDSPRYERQKRLSQIGAAGQERLGSATVAVIGLGALGSVASDLLVRAGVGGLTLIDRDVVDWSNLGRQILFDEEDARRSRPKAEAAALRLRRINAETALRVEPADLAPGNLVRLLQGAGLLLDGTDNFETRYLLNDFAVREGMPYVYAGAVGTYGMVGAVVPGGPCLRCTYPEAP